MQTIVSRPTRVVSVAAIEQGPSGTGAERLLAAARDLAPAVAARAEEIERGRRIPQDIIEALRATGMFKALVPSSHGGLGLSIPDVLPVLQILSAADGSVGWVMMVNVTAQLFCSRLQRPLYDKLFGGGAAPMVIGAGTPAGRAEKVPGGYRVSGRWPFASGCQHAQWIAGHCVVWEDGKPVMVDEAPVMLFAALPAEHWRIEETWNVSGLSATGSHHIVLDQAEVPESQTCDAVHGPSCLPGLFEAPFLAYLPATHAAVGIGIASGAFDDLMAMANTNRRQLFATADLRDSTIFQHEVGRVGAELRAAKALLDAHSAALRRGVLDAKVDFTEALQAGAWIHTACAKVVDRCYELAGSAVLTSPLERRLRDIHATGQHVFAGERFYAKAGALHLGFPPVDPLFGR
jgi:alkylation response protein AidB-like acyl-CoA dehydrogenase